MPHKALINLVTWHSGRFGGLPGRRMAQFTAIGFDFSLEEILSPLVYGGTLVVPDDEIRRDPNEFVRWLDQHQVNEICGPTLAIESLVEAANAQGLALPSLTDLYQGGEALTLGDRLREFCSAVPGRRLHNIYGPTETHAITAHTLPPDPSAWPVVAPIGKPVDNARVY
ncbi:AMP-binding protein, partial [Streptomyces lucensis]|uniref:AMP-binding protein n=1 Tax=Streptomyces lucensis TaxID=67319 RepID=UPI001E3E97C8